MHMRNLYCSLCMEQEPRDYHWHARLIRQCVFVDTDEGPGGSMSWLVGLPNN